ncbi:hypothetical protein [Actinoplanes sp. NPDC049802]|uniref:hypothetical protein n=1 Tax=Actinoplanes sp. NPDC049802 TaxID=3154742 RepID=UPI0033ECA940
MASRNSHYFKPDWQIGAALLSDDKKVRAEAVTALRNDMIASKQWPDGLDGEGFGLLTLSQRQRRFIRIAKFGRTEILSAGLVDANELKYWWDESCILVTDGFLSGKEAAEAMALILY